MLLDGCFFDLLMPESRCFSWSCLPRLYARCIAACDCPMVCHGGTSMGYQRWRFQPCRIAMFDGSVSTAKRFQEFVARLLVYRR